MSGEGLWATGDAMGQTPGGTTGSAPKTFPIRSNGPEPWFRDRLDSLRSARIPTAQYPDGYLGTTRTRREDRLRHHGGARQNMRNYQRGIHVGSRVEPQQYLWTENIYPEAGIDAQMKGEKWSVTSVDDATFLTNDGKPMPRGGMSLRGNYNEHLQAQYARLAPNWR